jgi:DNA-binding TFAR19-related protein (PDSD5 family)
VSNNKKRETYLNKKKHPGVACRRGQPIYYEEVKEKLNLSLTPTAKQRLASLALAQGISRSEVIEIYLRSIGTECQ